MSLIDSLTIRRLREGNEIAFRMVYDLHSEQVYKLAFRFLKDSAWSEEVVQDVFLKLWLNREVLDERGNMWLYLYVIAKRICLNKLREIRNTTVLFEQLIKNIEIASNKTEEQLTADEMNQFAEKIIINLPSQQQLVFKLSREEGLSHKEIAQKLGLSPNTVKNHMVQALKTLRLGLQQSGYIYLLTVVFNAMMFKCK